MLQPVGNLKNVSLSSSIRNNPQCVDFHLWQLGHFQHRYEKHNNLKRIHSKKCNLFFNGCLPLPKPHEYISAKQQQYIFVNSAVYNVQYIESEFIDLNKWSRNDKQQEQR